MVKLVILECWHTDVGGAGADPAIEQCREVLDEITASLTDLDRRGAT